MDSMTLIVACFSSSVTEYLTSFGSATPASGSAPLAAKAVFMMGAAEVLPYSQKMMSSSILLFAAVGALIFSR